MPRSVMATGVVDEVLPAQELGPRILGHIKQKPAPILLPDSSVPMGDSQAMDGILHLLHQVGGVNFRVISRPYGSIWIAA
jgi:two-component system CheB/CheR fusion protein